MDHKSSSSSKSDKSQSRNPGEDKKRKEKERAEKERIRKEHAKKILEEQKVQKARRKWQKNSEFLCFLKFRNSLPNPFLGPNLLNIPFPLERLTQYRPNSLDVGYKWHLHCERHLGVAIDLIDPVNYLVPTRPPALDPEDQALLEWKGVGTGGADGRSGAGSSKAERNEKTHGRSLVNHLKRKAVDTNVTWMKRTMYLSNDLYESVHRFKSGGKEIQELNMKLDEDMIQVTAMSAATKIAASFNSANDLKGKKALRHSSNPALTPEWILPVLPDASLWANNYMHVGFECDPVMQDEPSKDQAFLSAKRRRCERAIIADVREKDATASQKPVMVACYLVPDSDTETAETGAAESMTTLRGYHIEVKDTESTFIFFIDPEGGQASYCKLETRIDLKKGRPPSQTSEHVLQATLTRRDFSSEEIQQRSNSTKEVTEADYSEGEDDEEEIPGRLDQEDHHSSSHSAEGDRQSVISELPESEGSNKAVKGTESSGNDGVGADDSDDSDL